MKRYLAVVLIVLAAMVVLTSCQEAPQVIVEAPQNKIPVLFRGEWSGRLYYPSTATHQFYHVTEDSIEYRDSVDEEWHPYVTGIREVQLMDTGDRYLLFIEAEGWTSGTYIYTAKTEWNTIHICGGGSAEFYRVM